MYHRKMKGTNIDIKMFIKKQKIQKEPLTFLAFLPKR